MENVITQESSKAIEFNYYLPVNIVFGSGKVLETGEAVYMADIANCGLPIYMSKSEYEPSNMSTAEYLKIRFYYFNPEEDVFVKMENLSMEEYEPGIRLMLVFILLGFIMYQTIVIC